MDSANGASTDLASIALPSGSYQLSFTAYGSGADAGSVLVCRVTASDATTRFVQPTLTTRIANGSGVVGVGTNPTIATEGVLASALAQTVKAQCALAGGTATAASVVSVRLTALKVATVH